MKPLDFERWALVAPNDDTGLGRMAQDMKAMLPIGRHLITLSERMSNRPLVEPREILLDSACPTAELEAKLEGLQGIIFFERPNWHADLLPTLRRLGLRSVCVPMWEWFCGRSPQWRNCDFFACPNEVCLRIVRSYGYQNSALVPWVLNLSRFPARAVRGPARHFIHNAGLIDPDDRKGTRDAIAAFSRVPQPNLRLTVRTQKDEQFSKGDNRINFFTGNLPNPASLYAEGEVFIQPSKLEGMGFMVLEAVVSGLPVITLDSPPMNEWVRQPELLARARWFSYPAYSSAWIEHSHLRLPHIGDLARKIAWASEHDLEAISKANRAWAEKTFAPESLYEQWTHILSHIRKTPLANCVVLSPEPLQPCHSIPNRIRRKVNEMTGWQIPFFETLE
jgi:glycosyltransferase involved in cell wall biosynthesis